MADTLVRGKVSRTSDRDEKWLVRNKIVFAAFVLAAFGALCVHLFDDEVPGGGKPIPFSSADWKRVSLERNAASGLPNTRLRMMKDLLSRVELVGKSREEIHDILGPPDPQHWAGPDGQEHPGWALASLPDGIGRATFVPLLIYFDANETVTGYWTRYRRWTFLRPDSWTPR